MHRTKATNGTQVATFVDLCSDNEPRVEINNAVREHLAQFLRISYDDKEVMLEGDQRKVYGDGVGHLWFMKDGFVADFVAAGHGHISEAEVNAALHMAGVGRSVLRIGKKTYRTWKTTDTAFPHADGHERRTRAGVPMVTPGGLPTATKQSPLGTLTAQATEDWEIENVDHDKRTGTTSTLYVNVRTQETRVVATDATGKEIPGLPTLPGVYIANPKHSAKRQAWDCINHEAGWLPAYYYDRWCAARDAGLSLEQLWLVLEDLIEKMERRATYAEHADLWDMKCHDAAEFMAGPRWHDREPEFSTAQQLTGRGPVAQLEHQHHDLAYIKAALARGDPMYASPKELEPPAQESTA